jgi:hypothetical protein
LEDELAARRRAALAEICDEVAGEVVDRVVAEAVRASNFFGLSGDVARRYGASVRGTLPVALTVLREADAAERERRMSELVARVLAVSDEHHIPRIIERGLVSIAFGVTRRLVRERAAASSFTAEELDEEFIAFRKEFEQELFELSEGR